MDDKDPDAAREARDRSDVSEESEFEVFVERRVPCVGRGGEQQCVAVRRRPHDRFRGEIAAGAGTVLHDERLAETFRKPLTDQARIGVVDAARRKPGNDMHRLVWKGLRTCDARQYGQRSKSGGEVQKSAAWEFHRGFPP
jgi:hypothetical protein